MDILKSIVIWFTGILYMIIFFPLTLIVWLVTLPFDRNRSVTHIFLMYQSFVISYLIPVWRVKIEGRQKALRYPTCVIISNHQSILDILMINCLRLRFKWVSKIENTKVPVLGWYLRMAGYLTVDRDEKESKEKMLAEAYLYLKKGISVMMFPEGTRSQDCRVGFFKRGAFQLALSAGVPIIPVLIDGTGSVLPKHGLVFRGFHRITVKVLDPVPTENFPSRDHDLLARYFQDMLTDELQKLRTGKTGR